MMSPSGARRDLNSPGFKKNSTDICQNTEYLLLRYLKNPMIHQKLEIGNSPQQRRRGFAGPVGGRELWFYTGDPVTDMV